MKSNNDLIFDSLIFDIFEILNDNCFDEWFCDDCFLSQTELSIIKIKLYKLKELYYYGK